MRAWVIPYVMESIGLEPPQIRDAPKASEDLMGERGAVRFSGAARKKRRAATFGCRTEFIRE
jgi:hypothetical protein